MIEYCIDTACRHATTLGFDVTLVGDAHTTIDNEVLKAEPFFFFFFFFFFLDHSASQPRAQRVQFRQTRGDRQTGERDCFSDVVAGFWGVVILPFKWPYACGREIWR